MIFLLMSSLYLFVLSIWIVCHRHVLQKSKTAVLFALYLVAPPVSWYETTAMLLSTITKKRASFEKCLAAIVAAILCLSFVGWMGCFRKAMELFGFANLAVYWFIVPVAYLFRHFFDRSGEGP